MQPTPVGGIGQHRPEGVLLVPIVALVACTPGGPGGGRRPPAVDGVSPPTGDTARPDSGDSGATGDTAPALQCGDLPDDALSVERLDVDTTEDFDFDALGRLVYVRYTNVLEAIDLAGNLVPVSPDMPDTRGVQVLSTGQIATALLGQNAVSLTDPITGARTIALTGLDAPNALEVGDGDVLFVSETASGYGVPETGAVRMFDLATGAGTYVADGFMFPNGLALNPEQDVLYVADARRGIWAVPREADGTWGEKVLIVDAPGSDVHDGIEVDACGNVYTIGLWSGELVRFDPVTHDARLLVKLEDSGGAIWNSLRWGSDRGGWRRDVLYVTNRAHVFAVEVGIDGRAQPVDLAP